PAAAANDGGNAVRRTVAGCDSADDGYRHRRHLCGQPARAASAAQNRIFRRCVDYFRVTAVGPQRAWLARTPRRALDPDWFRCPRAGIFRHQIRARTDSASLIPSCNDLQPVARFTRTPLRQSHHILLTFVTQRRPRGNFIDRAPAAYTEAIVVQRAHG